jgi:hypothetical protein
MKEKEEIVRKTRKRAKLKQTSSKPDNRFRFKGLTWRKTSENFDQFFKPNFLFYLINGPSLHPTSVIIAL